ncbi:MAG: hypothetical protein OEZ06_31375 [Myxococcales bacterium]|nr:hypothetical protein [Myxococcales bacterium]
MGVAARPATLERTSGEVARVEVIAVKLGESLTLQRPDGSQELLPWASIASVALDAEPPRAGAAAAEPPRRAHGKGVETGMSAPNGEARAARIAELERQLADLIASRPKPGGPIAVMSLGFAMGGSAFLVSATHTGVSEGSARGCVEGCSDRDGSRAAAVVSVLGMGIGLVGLNLLVITQRRRRPISVQIRSLKHEINSLRFRLDARPEGASLGMSWSF